MITIIMDHFRCRVVTYDCARIYTNIGHAWAIHPQDWRQDVATSVCHGSDCDGGCGGAKGQPLAQCFRTQGMGQRCQLPYCYFSLCILNLAILTIIGLASNNFSVFKNYLRIARKKHFEQLPLWNGFFGTNIRYYALPLVSLVSPGSS